MQCDTPRFPISLCDAAPDGRRVTYRVTPAQGARIARDGRGLGATGA